MQFAYLLGKPQQTGMGGFVRCSALTLEPEERQKMDLGHIGSEIKDLNKLVQWRDFVKSVMNFGVL
jgi:hypothetical protein